MATQSAVVEKASSQQRWILASPLVTILIGHFAARLFVALLGDWAWVGTFLSYWAILLSTIVMFSEIGSFRHWFAPMRGSRWWILLAVLIGSIGFPLLLIPNLQMMSSAFLVILWFVFAIINATCEELYWRGFLLDSMQTLPRAFAISYSTVLHVAIHPAMLGVFSKVNTFHWSNPMAFLPFGIIAIILCLSFAAMYLGTKSLRVPIFSHFLSDLGSMSVFVFMNLVSMSPA